jgi:hypothetical protein
LKYEFVGEPGPDGLRQIRALRDIPRCGVKAGDLGGWIGSSRCLDQDDESWVGRESTVDKDSKVSWDSYVIQSRVVRSWIEDNTVVAESKICDSKISKSWIADSQIAHCSVYDSVIIEVGRSFARLWDERLTGSAKIISIDYVGGDTEPIVAVFSKDRTWLVADGVLGSLEELEAWAKKNEMDTYLRAIPYLRGEELYMRPRL